MKRSHGTAFRRTLIPLEKCKSCNGRAVIKGLFHHLDCIDCHASGWVRADEGEPLSLQDLVTQLSFNLNQAHAMLLGGSSDVKPVGLFNYYEQNNRRGAGGSNYTGD
ncbi:hypothetical protein KTT58_07135 [Pseudomonas viridiflava]|uniref:hypothetical protein n=1 Tax=Pseudomonas viridiflava TaxID=33069 RepID=UPI001C2D826F|nr:hypothetical protein [Pseudomonas viridiflava]MBV1812507.1 hypothetical protein [Pseudomonas viridiflava]